MPYRPIQRTVELGEPARHAINAGLTGLRDELLEQLNQVRAECVREARETLAEVRTIRDETHAGWASIIESLRRPITVPSPPPMNDRDALDALGVMRRKQPTLSEIVTAVDEEKLKRDGRAVENFTKAVRKGMHDGVRKAIAWVIAGLAIWLLHDLLPHARVLPSSSTVEPAGPSLAPVPTK